jgi:hypothetical protein
MTARIARTIWSDDGAPGRLGFGDPDTDTFPITPSQPAATVASRHDDQSAECRPQVAGTDSPEELLAAACSTSLLEALIRELTTAGGQPRRLELSASATLPADIDPGSITIAVFGAVDHIGPAQFQHAVDAAWGTSPFSLGLAGMRVSIATILE